MTQVRAAAVLPAHVASESQAVVVATTFHAANSELIVSGVARCLCQVLLHAGQAPIARKTLFTSGSQDVNFFGHTRLSSRQVKLQNNASDMPPLRSKGAVRSQYLMAAVRPSRSR